MLNAISALNPKLESMELIVTYSDTQNHYELRDIQKTKISKSMVLIAYKILCTLLMLKSLLTAAFNKK